MGLLNDLVQGLNGFFNTIDRAIEGITNPRIGDEQASDAVAGAIEDISPAEEVAGVVVDLVEEFIQSDLEEAGELDPDTIEEVTDDLEGASMAVLFGVALAGTAVEAAGLGQLDGQNEYLIQALAGLQVDDVAGRELEARVQEGVDPALKQKVHRDHRSKQADFQDFTEAAVRSKAFDGAPEPLGGEIPEELRELLTDEDLDYLPDPDTYGTIPEQTPLYELVGLESREPEELIEEPVQYGVHVPRRAIEATTNLAGMPKLEKEVFKSIPDKTPKTENIIQEYIRLTEVNFRLREAVQAGAISPEKAQSLIEPELQDLITNAVPEELLREEDRTAEEVAAEASEELLRNYQLLNSIPTNPPSISELQSFLQKGIFNSREFFSRYNELYGGEGRNLERFEESCIDKGIDGVVRQRRLGRIQSDDEALRQLEAIGLTGEEARRVLEGDAPENVPGDREQSPQARAVEELSTVPNIGDTRGFQLFRAGIESIEDLAAADQQRVVEVTDLTGPQARDVISAASTILDG
jgi:hypothetical protein